MEERRQSQDKLPYTSVDKLYNLKPYRDYINNLKVKDKSYNNTYLPNRDGLSKEMRDLYNYNLSKEDK